MKFYLLVVMSDIVIFFSHCELLLRLFNISEMSTQLIRYLKLN